jgi:hypothetical protein
MMIIVVPMSSQVLSPFFEWAKTMLFRGASHAYASLVDGFYESAFKPAPFPSIERVVAYLLLFVGMIAAGILMERSITGEWPKGMRESKPYKGAKKAVLNTLVFFGIMWMLLLIVLGVFTELFYCELKNRYDYVMAVAAPGLTDKQARVFNARFILVRTKADYDTLISDIIKAASPPEESEQ